MNQSGSIVDGEIELNWAGKRWILNPVDTTTSLDYQPLLKIALFTDQLRSRGHVPAGDEPSSLGAPDRFTKHAHEIIDLLDFFFSC